MSYSDWKTTKLSNLINTVSETYKFSGNQKVVLINTSDVLEGKVLNHNKELPVNVAGQFKKTFKKNDILYSEIRPANKRYAYIDFESKNYVASTKLMVLRIKNNEIDTKFLYQFLKSEKTLKTLQAVAESRSGTFPQITFTELSNLEIDLPTIKEQEAIANILSSLDDKIEINNKINKNLEDLAQTLYKHWFVDFEFPNGDGEPYKSSGGEMVDSELGLIPKSWNINKLCDISEIERGLSYKGKHLCESGVPMINLGSVKAKGGYNYDKIKFYNGDYKQKNVVSKGDIIIANTDMTSTRDILGTPIMVPSIYHGDIIFSHHLYALRKMKISRSYLYCYLKSDTFKSIAENYANGTTVLAIAKNDVEQAPVLIPSDVVLNLFSSIVDNVIDTVSNNEVQNISLTKTRDELLPKLMNGEIEVSIEV